MRLVSNRLTRCPLATAFALALAFVSGCGGGSGGGGDTVGETGVSAGGGSADGDAPPPNDPDSPGEGGPNVDREPPVPSGPDDTADCGASSISPTAPSGVADAPAPFTIDDIVSGALDPDSLSDGTHYWETTLEPGRYRLVLDSSRVDGTIGRIGLELRGRLEGEDDWRRLESTDESDRRIREASTLTLSNSSGRPMRYELSVTAKYGPERYELALLDEESAVPSPYFVDCPEVAVIALDTAESFVLAPTGAVGEEKWFVFDRPVREYALSVAASRDDGAAAAINFELKFLATFGDNPRGAPAEIVVDAPGPIFSERYRRTIFGPEDGAPYLRLRNLGDALRVEISLSEGADDP